MKKYIALTLALLMSLSLMACGSKTDDGSTDADGSGDQEGSNTLVLGTSADYAPFEFMYPDDSGEMVYGGIDVSVAKYIADEMGLTLQVENMGFDYLLPSLDKGDFDIVLAAMEATPERLETADFSDPYYTDEAPLIVVRKADLDQYKTLEDFSGKTVGAQTGTTKADIVLGTDPEKPHMTDVQDLLLPKVTDLIAQLQFEKCDAVVLDAAVAQKYVASNDELAIVESIDLGEAAEPYRVWVAKGDPKGLLPGINAAIAKMNEANMLENFIADAGKLADVAVNVTAD